MTRVTIEVDRSFDRNLAEFSHLASEANIRRWTRNSLNYAIRRLRTKMVNQVSKEVRIDKHIIKARIKIYFAKVYKGRLNTLLRARANPIPLHRTGDASQFPSGVMIFTDKYGEEFYPQHFMQRYRGQNLVFVRKTEGTKKVPRYPILLPKKSLDGPIQDVLAREGPVTNQDVSTHFAKSVRKAAGL